MDKAKGYLVENRIIVWDITEARSLFKEGFYGKPLGIPKPKAPDFNAPLVLDLIEGYHLMKEGRLAIHDSVTGKGVRAETVDKICKKEYVDFEEKFLAYRVLRKAGYIVAPGIKFGCDFAVYEHGPGIDHAPFLFQVCKPGDHLTATGIVLSGRLATTVRKQFVVAVSDTDKQKVDFVSFDWWRA